MKIVVGLGNPGPQYRNTRHNVGFRALDDLADRIGGRFDREKYKGQIAEGQAARGRVLLLKPLTFMNRSGESVAQAARNNVNGPDDLLVIYDDAEIPLGRLRMRARGSAGSHNGMRSVIERVGTNDIPRLRMGVGRGKGDRDLADHVLSSFHPDEAAAVNEMVTRAVDAALEWIENGTESAMNRFNRADDTPKAANGS